MGDKFLQGEKACTRIGRAGRERGDFQSRSVRQHAGALPSVHLTGCEHVKSGVRMHLVVPGIELVEVILGRGLVGKVTGKHGLGLDRRKVGFDVRIVIGRAWPTEELLDAQFLEVGLGRVRAHLGAAIAERLGPRAGGLIQQVFVDQAVIPQRLHAGARQLGPDEPSDVFAAPVIEQAIEIEEDAALQRMEIGDIPVPELVGAVHPVRIRRGAMQPWLTWRPRGPLQCRAH